MTSFVFNIAKGAVAEKVRDGATVIGVLLLKTSEAVDAMKDYDTVADLLAGAPAEADFTNYARKTGITATLTVDDTNNWVDIDIPDQTWTSAGGATNNTLTHLIVYYQESAADSGRIPLTAHDFALTTSGADLTAVIPTGGFYRARDE